MEPERLHRNGIFLFCVCVCHLNRIKSTGIWARNPQCQFCVDTMLVHVQTLITDYRLMYTVLQIQPFLRIKICTFPRLSSRCLRRAAAMKRFRSPFQGAHCGLVGSKTQLWSCGVQQTRCRPTWDRSCFSSRVFFLGSLFCVPALLFNSGCFSGSYNQCLLPLKHSWKPMFGRNCI